MILITGITRNVIDTLIRKIVDSSVNIRLIVITGTPNALNDCLTQVHGI